MTRAPSLVVRPIGFVRSPFGEKADAPRQAVAAKDVEGTIELLPEHELALSDLEGFERIWILFWFDRATRTEGEPTRAKVLPPRSQKKRGVFATRSPHRPNPIGMSAVRLVGVSGRFVTVRDIDLLDGTPVLDLKPYVPYADSFPESHTGWLARADPLPPWQVRFSPRAEQELAWIGGRADLVPDLRARVAEVLALGPQPHPYRRIKELADGARLLAVKDWRARFTVSPAPERAIVVEAITTGYRPRDLERGSSEAHALHRAFVARFGP